MDYPLISIVIPTFNEGAWLERTVKSCLEKTDYPDFEIIVVGDGCTDGSVEALQAKNYPNVKMATLDQSQGAIVARNQGAKLARGKILVFIDSHQEPITENWLVVLVDLLRKPQCGAATINIASIGEVDRLGYFYCLKDWTLEPTWKKPERLETEALAPAIPGGCFAISKALFTQTGGFNENLKKWGREDFEYSLRLWRLGYDLWFSSKAVMGHAFDHQRAFKISWQEVDFNTLYIAKALMNQAAFTAVKATLKTQRPKTAQRVISQLDKINLEPRNPASNVTFARPFDTYQALYMDF